VLFFVAYNTVFVNLVEREHYVEANSLTNGSRAATFVVGPSIAGLLVQAVSGPFTLLIDAVSFLVSAVFLGAIHPRQPEPEEHERGSVMVGARFIAGDLMLRTMMFSIATINLFNFAFWAIYFLYVTHALHISAGAIGVVIGTAAIGTLLGSVITGPLTRRFGIGPVYTLGVILFPLPLLLVPLASGPRPLVYAMLVTAEFISGIGLMMLDINGGAIYQAAVPERLISRFWGAFMTVNYGVRPVGSLAGGLLGEALGLRPALWIASAGALIGVLFLLPTPVPRMRDLPERRA
jgi:predicted MFS family arabinose efflux permease